MIKKIIALAATSLFSLNASAGYIEYVLNGPVTGLVVQHDNDKAIALYNLTVEGFNVGAYFQPSGVVSNITSASTTAAGPTNFSVFDNRTDFYFETLSLRFFARTPTAGIPFTLYYEATYSQRNIPDLPPTADAHPLTAGFGGSVTQTAVPDWIAAGLDANGGYDGAILRLLPTVSAVPEPGSLALLAVGALGMAKLRRRKPARQS
jgi:hypothetical protein